MINQIKQKVKLNNIITGRDLDYTNYNLKVDTWNKIVLAGQRDIYKHWLNDLTIFSLDTLRDDDENPFLFTAYQAIIAQCKHDFKPNNPNRYIIFKASNQIGKSRYLVSSAIQKAFLETNVNIILVSRSLPQSQYLLATIRHVLNNSTFGTTWRESVGETANTTVLTFQREKGKIVNRIICAPCGEGLLGYPVHYLFLDEADFYEDGKTFFWKVAFPRTNKTKGQIVLFSNPNPDISRQSSILYELWTSEMVKRKFTFNFLDAPWNTKEEYEQAQQAAPNYIFMSTHGGEFPIDSGGFFSRKEIKDMMVKEWDNIMPMTSRQVFISLDLAKVKDKSVLALGYPEVTNDPLFPELHVKYLKEYESKTPYTDVIADVRRIVNYYESIGSSVVIGYDATGVGKAVGEMIEKEGLTAIEIIFSMQSKGKMYADFKMMAEQRRLKIVHVDECESQVANLIFTKTSSGNIQVKHEKEYHHDDYPDALAMLIKITINPSYIEPSMKVF